MKPYRTCPKRVGCESPFCRSSSLSPYRQNRLLHVRSWLILASNGPGTQLPFYGDDVGEGEGGVYKFLCLSRNFGGGGGELTR
jgi:hypothetical protein